MTLLGPYLIGLSGTELSASDKAHISSDTVGGVILFTRNFIDISQLIEYVREVRSSGGAEKIIFVDHEGGRVQRFRDGFTAIPPMRKLGQLARTDFDLALLRATQVGYVLASELRACDLDMSFTPVLDLDWGNSEIIGDRAFDADPVVVSRLANALIQGLNLAGMQACGKHFPGHGWVKVDSHIGLPVDTRSFDEIVGKDALPYQFNTSLSMASIMPAHVVYEQVDDKPACFSSRWLKETLRDRLKFDGAIISDDLDMVGAHAMGGILERAQAALTAGCDAVLACNNLEDISELVTKPVPAVALGQVERQRRLARLKGAAGAMDWKQLRSSKDYQLAVEALKDL